jgi:hypothetical protein
MSDAVAARQLKETVAAAAEASKALTEQAADVTKAVTEVNTLYQRVSAL